ncbi:hypothetical protein [Microbacterium sp.]|uniref:hypothetical protein n=1 Tax=Microbacterium sp. TaxID=51671 RepID=UPI00289DE3C9|nr:hypothetical protein [Microbacterium sp.]
MSADSPFSNTDPSDSYDDAADVEVASLDDGFSDDDGVLYDDEVTPEYGILGFTLRELLITGAWLVAFIASFFPYFGDSSIWASGLHWILPIGLPTVAVFLVVLRRFSPDGIRRVGSLGIDQFASVAFSVSAVFWLAELWNSIAVSIGLGTVVLSWNGIVQLIGALALVVFTVFAPLVPGLKEDFHGRLVTLAHRNANPVRPVIARPRPVVEPDAARGDDSGTATVTPVVADGHTDGVDATAIPVVRDESTDPAGESTAPADESAAPADESIASGADALAATPAVEPSTSGALRSDRFDPELSGEQATDEVARLDLAEQVPLASHASGGDTGTEDSTSDEAYVPTYSRRSSWNQEPEIVSDTGSIESLMGATAQEFGAPRAEESTGYDSSDHHDTLDHHDTPDHHDAGAAETTVIPTFDDPESDRGAWRETEAAQPFWILAPTDRDVHDERGDALFRIGPSAWVLVIEDRGGAYVVRHDDGRIGYLHDIADITKG